MSHFHKVIGRAVASEEFCAELLANPEGVLRSNGVEPTTQMLTALSRLDAGSVRRLANAFGQKGAAAV
jgi:hypothetical protein